MPGQGRGAERGELARTTRRAAARIKASMEVDDRNLSAHAHSQMSSTRNMTMQSTAGSQYDTETAI